VAGRVSSHSRMVLEEAVTGKAHGARENPVQVNWYDSMLLRWYQFVFSTRFGRLLQAVLQYRSPTGLSHLSQSCKE
jgi:hypothetical protein